MGIGGSTFTVDPAMLYADERVRTLWNANPMRLDYDEGAVQMVATTVTRQLRIASLALSHHCHMRLTSYAPLASSPSAVKPSRTAYSAA